VKIFDFFCFCWKHACRLHLSDTKIQYYYKIYSLVMCDLLVFCADVLSETSSTVPVVHSSSRSVVCCWLL